MKKCILKPIGPITYLLAFLVAQLSCHAGVSASESVKEFVRSRHPHFPSEQAARFTNEDVPILLKMLDDSDESRWWPNIVTTLGIIGDERAVGPLIEFFEKQIDRDIRGLEDHYVYGALQLVPSSLGRLARHGSDKAFQYVKECMDPAAWGTKITVAWKFNGEPGHVSRQGRLMIRAAVGLRLSERAEALVILQDLAKKDFSVEEIGGMSVSAFKKQLGGLAEELQRALKEKTKVDASSSESGEGKGEKRE